MMRNLFGWSLPPGVTGRMIDEAMTSSDAEMWEAWEASEKCPKLSPEAQALMYGDVGDLVKHFLAFNWEEYISFDTEERVKLNKAQTEIQKFICAAMTWAISQGVDNFKAVEEETNFYYQAYLDDEAYSAGYYDYALLADEVV